MSVPVQTTFTAATGNGVTTVFPFQFLIQSGDDLQVFVNGVAAAQGVGYTVSGLNVSSGGAVTFPVAPPVGANIVMRRVIALMRNKDYQYQGEFNSETVNRDFDRLWMALQNMQGQSGTSLRVAPPEQFPELVSAALRAGKLLGFDASGNPVPIIANDQSATSLALTLLSVLGLAQIGFKQAGTGAIPQTAERKAQQMVDVLDYGGKGIGEVSATDYTAFQSAINALPARGGKIHVGPGIWYFSAEPVFGTKSLHWDIDPGAVFIGPGTLYGMFRTRTQNGNLPSGPWTVDRILEPTRFTDCLNSQSIEAIIDDPAVPRYMLTGNLATNSKVISNVSSFAGIALGTPIYDGTLGVSGLAYGYDASQARVDSFNVAAKTITLTIAYTGAPVTAANLRTDFLQWKSALYNGVRLNSKSRDSVGWAQNAVVEFMPGAEGVGYGLEIDLAMYGVGGKGIGRAFLASGHGDYDPDTAYETSFSGLQRWKYGLKLGKVHNGIRVDADNTGLFFATQPNRGIVDAALGVTEFDSNFAKSWLALKQMANNTDAIVVARATDDGTGGTFARFMNSAKSADVFRLETSGFIYAPNLPVTPPGLPGYLWVDGSTTPPTVRRT